MDPLDDIAQGREKATVERKSESLLWKAWNLTWRTLGCGVAGIAVAVGLVELLSCDEVVASLLGALWGILGASAGLLWSVKAEVDAES